MEGCLKDKNNQVVVTKLDDTLLKEIAEATNATYTRSTSGDFHLEKLYFESIRGEISQEKLQSGMLKKWKETFQIFSMIAFVLLLFDSIFSLNFSFAKIFRRKSVYEKGVKK